MAELDDPFFKNLIIDFGVESAAEYQGLSDRLQIERGTIENMKKRIAIWKQQYLVVISNIKEGVGIDDSKVSKNLEIRNLSVGSPEYMRAYRYACEYESKLEDMEPESYEAQTIVLLWALYKGNRLDYCRNAIVEDALLFYPECCIPCTMHGEGRIGEGMLSRLQQETYNMWNSTVGQKAALAKMQEIAVLYNSALGGAYTESSYASFDPKLMSYELKIDVKANKVEPFKISCVRQRKIMAIWEKIVNCCFDSVDDGVPRVWLSEHVVHTERKEKLIEIGKLFIAIRDGLRGDDDLSDAAIDVLQVNMDNFCELHGLLYGVGVEQNYVHLWESGDMIFPVRRYRNIHRHNTTCMEATVGYVRGYLLRRTNREGVK